MPFIPIVQNNQLFIKKICEFSRLVSWGRKVIETKQINKKELKRPNFFFEGEQSVSGFPVSLPLSKLFASVCKKEELVLGSLDGSDLYLFFSSVCAAFQPSAPARLTPQGLNLQAPAGTEMGKVWLVWQVSAVPASLPRRCPLILPLPSSWAINHTQNETQIWYLRPLKKTILWIHGLHKCKKHNKNIVSGAITWFWLSQWYIITLCSCYNAGTWPPSSFCWGERMVVNEMCGLGSSALLLPMAGVSWVFCVCNTQQNYVFICVPMCPSGAVCLLELETQHVCWLRGWTVVCAANLFKNI